MNNLKSTKKLYVLTIAPSVRARGLTISGNIMYTRASHIKPKRRSFGMPYYAIDQCLRLLSFKYEPIIPCSGFGGYCFILLVITPSPLPALNILCSTYSAYIP